MGGCFSSNKNDDDGPFKDDGVSDLKNKRRWCTDILFLVRVKFIFEC